MARSDGTMVGAGGAEAAFDAGVDHSLASCAHVHEDCTGCNDHDGRGNLDDGENDVHDEGVADLVEAVDHLCTEKRHDEAVLVVAVHDHDVALDCGLHTKYLVASHFRFDNHPMASCENYDGGEMRRDDDDQEPARTELH